MENSVKILHAKHDGWHAHQHARISAESGRTLHQLFSFFAHWEEYGLCVRINLHCQLRMQRSYHAVFFLTHCRGAIPSLPFENHSCCCCKLDAALYNARMTLLLCLWLYTTFMRVSCVWGALIPQLCVSWVFCFARGSTAAWRMRWQIKRLLSHTPCAGFMKTAAACYAKALLRLVDNLHYTLTCNLSFGTMDLYPFHSLYWLAVKSSWQWRSHWPASSSACCWIFLPYGIQETQSRAKRAC